MCDYLSSPRGESARAFTGRQNSYSGRGEDFLSRQPIFFTETAVIPERKVENWFPRWEINQSDFWAKNRNFGSKKEVSLFNSNHVLATTGKSCSKKKSAFAQIIKGGNVILGDFLG